MTALLVLSVPVFSQQAEVILGTAGNFVILSKAGITNEPNSDITGHLGVSPIDHTAITGFGTLTNDDTHATSAQVTGEIYASDMLAPTPAYLTTAISNMETAYTDAATRSNPDYLNLLNGNLNGQTLYPGLYKWGGTVTITNNITIAGNEDDVWIFQIDNELITASSANVILGGNAHAKNIFWQVGEGATFGTNSHFKGIILSQTGIHFQTGASFTGRALAQTSVTLDQNLIVSPELDPGSLSVDSIFIPENLTILKNNYPNPFNPTTTISYSIKEDTPVQLVIYNVLGQVVKKLVHQTQRGGDYTVVWNGTDDRGLTVPSGVYLSRLETDHYIGIKKMILMK